MDYLLNCLPGGESIKLELLKGIGLHVHLIILYIYLRICKKNGQKRGKFLPVGDEGIDGLDGAFCLLVDLDEGEFVDLLELEGLEEDLLSACEVFVTRVRENWYFLSRRATMTLPLMWSLMPFASLFLECAWFFWVALYSITNFSALLIWFLRSGFLSFSFLFFMPSSLMRFLLSNCASLIFLFLKSTVAL